MVLLFIFYLLIAMFPSLDSKAAQDCEIVSGVSVCLNGDDNVDVLVSEDFTLSNVPTGSTIAWQASGLPALTEKLPLLIGQETKTQLR